MDAVHFLAAKHQLELKSRAGDLTYIHNLSVLHGRTSFQDGAFESEMRRSVRMWLRDDEKAWDLGDSGPLVDAWDRVYGKHEEIAENWEVDDQRTAECAARMTKSFRSCVD